MRKLLGILVFTVTAQGVVAPEQLERIAGLNGRPGGTLVVGQRAEPKTLNPVVAMDAPSREVTRPMHADLITIDRQTQKSRPELAESWSVSKDGKEYMIRLRRGLRFSDGHPFDASDVVFTFQAYLDERTGAPQRDLLIIGGQPIKVTQSDDYTVRFQLAQPYGAGERIFDSIPILPKHLLEQDFAAGRLAQSWTLATASSKMAGLGPFRLKQYSPGERIVLERNPYYWKTDASGQRLPYLDGLVFINVANEDALMLRFLGGETDILQRLSGKNYALIEREAGEKGARPVDAGPSLEYNFLFFNLNDSRADQSDRAARQSWFKDVRFRRAVSAAIDRDAIVKLVFDGRATPLATQVTPGNKLWQNTKIPVPRRDLAQARSFLRESGFRWDSDGRLVDVRGGAVEFTIVTSSSSRERTQMAALIQEDLKQLGITVQVVPLEFRSLLDRVLKAHDFDAGVLGLGGGEVDPNSEINVWLSSGGMHLWRPGQTAPGTAWEAEIDRLMERQLTERKQEERKRCYDRVQELVAEQLPIIPLVSPHVLVAVRDRVANFHPVVMNPSTLWNVEQLYYRSGPDRK